MPNTIDKVKLQATSDTLRVAFPSWLEFNMSSCGYIRSSILPILSEFAVDGYYTEKENLEVHLSSVKELN